MRAARSKRQGPAGASVILLRNAVALLLALGKVDPAGAQVRGSLGVDSDYRLRGYSVTDNHPALSAEISYDDPSGAYVSATAIGELGGRSRFLGGIGSVGYAKRLNRRVTIDAGLLRSQVRSADSYGNGFEYMEVYGGAYIGPVSGHVYYSPSYRRRGEQTLYGELECGFEPLKSWHLSAHLGLLAHLRSSGWVQSHRSKGDLSALLSHQFGRVDVHVAVSAGGGEAHYPYRPKLKTAVSAGARIHF